MRAERPVLEKEGSALHFKCGSCQLKLPEDSFYRGQTSQCKECKIEWQMLWREAKLQGIKETVLQERKVAPAFLIADLIHDFKAWRSRMSARRCKGKRAHQAFDFEPFLQAMRQYRMPTQSA